MFTVQDTGNLAKDKHDLSVIDEKKVIKKIDTEIEVQSFLLRRRPFWQMAMPSNWDSNF
jgi:hypothetical protein